MTSTATEQTRSVQAHERALQLIERAVNLPAAGLAEWRGQVAELLNRIEIGRVGRHHKTLNKSTPTAALLAITSSARARVLAQSYADRGADALTGEWDAEAIKILGKLARVY